MKQIFRRTVSLLLVCMLLCALCITGNASATKIITDPTGYTKASDVAYQFSSNNIVINWGARGEDCVFLSSYAVSFYTSGNTFDALSKLDGGTSRDTAPDSELYDALQELMVSRHTHETTYGETRYQYGYTDCLKNDTTQISSFYSGKMFGNTWDQGATWNREHTWPASKSLSGRPSNSDDGEGADIIMLRPTLKAENGSRSNDAYGLSSGYEDPGVSVRGDCARILLYVYVRWGNDKYMWGKNGVIESLDLLLDWMEEDPVDTWEMGRNDAVQSITGTRNVFVDYPEYAWLLFGQEVPDDMVTPSGEAKSGVTDPTPPVPTGCQHPDTDLRGQKAATCLTDGFSGNTVCADCGEELRSGYTIPATGHKDENADHICDTCSVSVCVHTNTELQNAAEASCKAEGYTGDTVCIDCGSIIITGTAIAKTEHTTTVVGKKDATCAAEGYTGDTVCSVCSDTLLPGSVIPATGSHTYGEWTIVQKPSYAEGGLEQRQCENCTDIQLRDVEKLDATPVITVVIIAVAVAAAAAVAVVLIIKHKKNSK